MVFGFGIFSNGKTGGLLPQANVQIEINYLTLTLKINIFVNVLTFKQQGQFLAWFPAKVLVNKSIPDIINKERSPP